MNRFTPFIEPRRRRPSFCDGLVFGVAFASLIFAGGFALVLFALAG